MTTTPKSVILAVVVVLGTIAIAVIGGQIVLQLTHNGSLPDSIVVIGAGAAGAVGGVLASTRTMPDLPEGSTLTSGSTTLTNPTASTPLVTVESDYRSAPVVAADQPR